MRSSVYYKFILGYLLFALLCIIFINTWMTKHTTQELIEKQVSVLVTQKEAILSIINSENMDISALTSENFQSLDSISNTSNTNILILSSNYQIYYDSKRAYIGDVLNFYDPFEASNSQYLLNTYYGLEDHDILSVTSRINSFSSPANSSEGFLTLYIDAKDIYKEVNTTIGMYYIMLIATFVFSLVFLIIFTFAVYIPLRKISKASMEYAKGNLKYEGLKKFTSEDEIGNLGVSLSYMASKLDDMEEYQKKFLSNVSHDFRSPLTSIKGYIGAMKDGTIPVEEQSKYLDIVLFETDRLTKLTQNILTLNNWENNAIHLEITEFDLFEMLKPIISSLETKASKKSISIILTPESRNYIVSGDQGKIQQVVYNLIDNAIKFSQSNSVIKLETVSKGEKVFVSVEDSGIGIPKESLDKIWTRFYKTDLSRGKDKTGSGLGLSITKEIIKAHGENINVVSTEGVGTVFTFSLKKIKGKVTI